MTLDNIREEINKANTIVILTHETPDEYADTFKFLPNSKEIKKEGRKDVYDLAIALDCGDIKRLNGFAKYFEDAKVTINIDHHSSNTMFADYNFVNPDAPATCQILILVLEHLKINITKEIGTCLLTGIITDTGGFKYAATTAETFEFTAWLLGIGVNVADTYKRVLEIKTRSNFELTKIAENRIEFLEEGKISYTYITKEDENRVNAKQGDHEGLVNIGREIKGVEVSVLLREDKQGYKVSLRSNNYVNVADICVLFGGGGHIRAAGCLLHTNLQDAKDKIINEIKKHLR